VEAWTTIRYLHAQGQSIRGIAKELSLSRNTVRSALRGDDPPRYKRPGRSNPQLEPFADQIEQMLVEKQFIGTRILRELRALGYQGSQSAFYEYLRQVKSTVSKSRISERFETAPGHQAQFDWSPYTIVLGGQTTKVTIFCLTLAFSRRKFYWPSLDATQASIFEAVEAGLQHFGGAPKELLVDNARALVVDTHPDHFVWNTHFLELCGHYRIQPRACRPARPQTKGKVERPFYYLEQHFIKGHSWSDFDDLLTGLATFTADELDRRPHSTTGEAPLTRFALEQDVLTPLPPLPFVGTYELMRKVSWDCLVSFAGSRYSVPWRYAGKQVWLRPSQGRRLLVRSQHGEEIARHTLTGQKHCTVIVPAHYDGLRKQAPQSRSLLEKDFLGRFPEAPWFIEALFIQHKNNGLRQLRAILSLAEVYSPETMSSAFEQARTYNTYSQAFIRGLVENSSLPLAASAPSACPQSSDNSVGADLQVYQRLLEATS